MEKLIIDSTSYDKPLVIDNVSSYMLSGNYLIVITKTVNTETSNQLITKNIVFNLSSIITFETVIETKKHDIK